LVQFGLGGPAPKKKKPPGGAGPLVEYLRARKKKPGGPPTPIILEGEKNFRRGLFPIGFCGGAGPNRDKKIKTC